MTLRPETGRVGARAPGPQGAPLLGHALAFRRDPLDFLLSAAQTYGPVTRLKLGPLTYHLVSDPALCTEVLQARASNYVRDTRSSRRIRLLTGESLLTTDGSVWKKLRQAAQPVFHHQSLVGLARTMAAVAGEASTSWEAAADAGTPLELFTEMSHLSFAVAGRCLFGVDLAARVGEVEQVFPCLLEELFRRTSEIGHFPLWVPLPRHRAFKRALSSIDGVVGDVIAAHRREARQEDLLGLLMKARTDEGEGMTDTELRNHVVTFLLAGQETTASALTWALALLSRAPEVLAKVRAELVAENFDPQSLRVGEILPRLECLGAVLQETLRLYPSIWIAERRVVADDVLGGFAIPAGSAVVVAPYVTHRLPVAWEAPEAFRPSRFLGRDPRTLARDGYFPFGAGPHVCIGQHFALMEMKIVLATLLSRFDVTLAQATLPLPTGGITLRPSSPIPIRLVRRAT